MSDFTPTAEQIDAVAEWRALRLEKRISRPLVPLLRERFKLSPLEALAVIKASGKGGAHGGS
jgi:hypothetical protein